MQYAEFSYWSRHRIGKHLFFPSIDDIYSWNIFHISQIDLLQFAYFHYDSFPSVEKAAFGTPQKAGQKRKRSSTAGKTNAKKAREGLEEKKVRRICSPRVLIPKCRMDSPAISFE